MKDEFDKIIDLFSLDAEEKEKRLDDIFHLSIAFIEKYKYMQAEGSKKEQEDVSRKLSLLRDKISEETSKSESSLNLSKEEIKELSKNEENFTKEQWNLLQKTKKTITKEKEHNKNQKTPSIKNTISKSTSTDKKKKTKRGKSSWLKS